MAALVRWEPARELRSVRDEFDRLFNSLLDPSAFGSAAQATRQFVPAIDIVETDDHFLIRADVPGLKEDDVKVEIQDNVLTLGGERQASREQKGASYYRVERSSGSFSRSITLPDGVDPAAIEAEVNNGVLEVRIPRPEQRKPHQVQIRAGAKADAERDVITAG